MNQFDAITVFEDIDHFDTGVITHLELKHYMQKMKLSTLEIEEGLTAFSDLEDTMELNEFLDAWSTLPRIFCPTGLSNTKMVQIFHELDTNNNGSIWKADLRHYLLKHGYSLDRMKEILEVVESFENISFANYFETFIYYKPSPKQIYQIIDDVTGVKKICFDEALNVFIETDRNDVGLISKFELQFTLQEMNYSKPEIEVFLKEFNDEEIIFVDYCRITDASPLENPVRLFKQIDAGDLFNAIDCNHNGIITKQKLAEYLYFHLYTEVDIHQILRILEAVPEEVSYATYFRIFELQKHQIPVITVEDCNPSDSRKDSESDRESWNNDNSSIAATHSDVDDAGRLDDEDVEVEIEEGEVDETIVIKLNMNPIEAFYEIDEQHTGLVFKKDLRSCLIRRELKDDEVEAFMGLFENCEEKVSFERYCEILGLDPQEFSDRKTEEIESRSCKESQSGKFSDEGDVKDSLISATHNEADDTVWSKSCESMTEEEEDNLEMKLDMDPIEVFYETDRDETGCVTQRQLQKYLDRREMTEQQVKAFMTVFQRCDEEITFEQYCIELGLDHLQFSIVKVLGCMEMADDMELLSSSLESQWALYTVTNLVRRCHNFWSHNSAAAAEATGSRMTNLTAALKRALDLHQPSCTSTCMSLDSVVWNCVLSTGNQWARFSSVPRCTVVLRYHDIVHLLFGTPAI